MPTPAFKSVNVFSPQVFAGNWVEEPLQYWEPNYNQQSWAATQFGVGTVQIMPFELPYQCVMTAVDCFLSQSYSATNAGSSQNQSLTMQVGIYSNQAGVLQLVASGSQSTVASVTGSTSSQSFQAVKAFPVPLSANLYGGDYWIAIVSSTSSAGNAIAAGLSNVVCSNAGGVSNYSGIYGAGSAVTQQVQFGLGIFTSTSSVLPLTMPFASIIGSGVGNTAQPVLHFKAFSA